MPVASTMTLLLPQRAHLAGIGTHTPALSRVLARADHESALPGDEAQLQRHFDLLPRGLPVAALTRQYDCGDAANQTWLRADPAHLRADLGCARMLACGELGLEEDEADQLLQALKPLFGDDGALLSRGALSRWYLMLPRDSRIPEFPPPSRVLGDDVFAHLPEGDAGRRWRRLLSEAQIVLHHHPVNEARVARGATAVNSLWFWGGGAPPDHVRCDFGLVCSDDLLMAALARAAGVEHRALDARGAVGTNALIDLRRVRDAEVIERDWIAPALDTLRGDATLQLDLADGLLLRYRRAHRWRVWRRTVPAPA